MVITAGGGRGHAYRTGSSDAGLCRGHPTSPNSSLPQLPDWNMGTMIPPSTRGHSWGSAHT